MRTRFCRPPREAQLLPRLRHRLVSPPSAHAREEVPTSRANFPPISWQRERVQRLARICRCLDRGRVNGKRLHEMLVWFAWRWKARTYKCDPTRKIRFSYVTLRRLYNQWRANAGNPGALALRYRAPVKLRRGHVQQFAGLCINSEARSFAEAYGKLPRPRATVYAYRLALGARPLRRVVKLFAARRLVDVRTRLARTAANRFATEGAR
jgi:hypothetical protein